MKELFDNYYRESFSQNKSQQLDNKSFELTVRKYRWNYRRFFTNLSKDTKILDLGCGIGQFLYYLKKEGFSNIIGIDISQQQVDIALQIQPNLNIQCIENPIDFLNSQPEEYNVITINDVLEHIEKNDLVPFIRSIHTALAKDGTLIIKTINSAYPFSYATRYADLTHTISFHEKSLTQLLLHCGFTSIQCYQEEIGLYNIFFCIKKIFVIITRVFLKCLIYLSESDWPSIFSNNIIVMSKKR